MFPLGRSAPSTNLADIAATSPDLLRAVTDRAERDPWLWYVVCGVHEDPRALARYTVAVAPCDANLVRRALDVLKAERLTDEALAVCRAHAKANPREIDSYSGEAAVRIEVVCKGARAERTATLSKSGDESAPIVIR